LNNKKFRGITGNKTNSVFRGIPKWHFRKHPSTAAFVDSFVELATAYRQYPAKTKNNL
jgi:hypothetical protein